MTHGKNDTQEKLQLFYDSKDPLVFVSPVCQQGVDFKGDRARFQIILRVPYLNTSDAFVSHKVQNDFPWYNYQALITWGQQIGRINRSEDDYGATFLMDSRFNKFITRNLSKIPKWVQSAIVWK
jgi:Rad3-related DNA helicase